MKGSCDTVYTTQQEAEIAMRTEKACANTPTGSSITPANPGSGTAPRP
jgi:hypothetical protein